MNRPTKILALSLALSIPLAGFIESTYPNIAYAASAERLNLGVDTSKAKFREDTVNLKQDEANKNETLNEIRAIRSRLWDENIYYTLDNSNKKSTKLQDIAKEYGYKSKDSYVNAVTWSNDLERIAIQRVYEQLLVDLSHDRADGTSFETTVTNNGIYANGENLAASTAQESPALAFSQWSFKPSQAKNGLSEYDILVNNKGVKNSDNGHLHLILSPRFSHIGFASLNGAGSEWNYATLNAGVKNSSNNQSSTGYVGQYRLYVGKPSKDTPKSQSKPANKAQSIEKLREAVERAKKEIAAAEYIMENYPKTVANVKDQLLNLIAQSKELIRKAEPALAKN